MGSESRPSSALPTPTPRGWALPGHGFGYGYSSGVGSGMGSERTGEHGAGAPVTNGAATSISAASVAPATPNGNGDRNGHSRGVSNDYERVMLPSPSPSEFSDVDVTDWVRRTQGATNGSHPTNANANNANTNVNGNTTPNGKRVPAQLFETPPSSSLYPYRIEQTPPPSHSHSHSHYYSSFEQHDHNNINGGPSSPPASSRSKHSFAETPSGDLSNHNLLNGSPLLPMKDVTGLGLGASLPSMTTSMNQNIQGGMTVTEAMTMINEAAAARNGSPTRRGANGTGVTPMLGHTENGNGNGNGSGSGSGNDGSGSAGTSRSATTTTRLPTFFHDDDDEDDDGDDLGVPMEDLDSPRSQIRVLGPIPERQNGSGKDTRTGTATRSGKGTSSGPSLPSFHCRLCFTDPCEEPTATVCGHIFCNR